MATNKEIIKKLECVESRLTNGELEEMHEMIKEIKEVLLDPEDGIIVRVNKNTYWRKQINIQEIEELKKLQGKVVKDWMDKAKGGVIDFFDLVRGFQSGSSRRAYPYEVEFLMSVLTKDKIINRFRKYFGGKKAMNNRTSSKK